MSGRWGLILLLACGAAQAAVYRCTVDGRTVYSDQPCSAGAEPAQLPPLNSAAAGARADLAKQYDTETARENEARRKARAEALDQYADRKAQDEAIRKALMEDRVVKGMTREQVERVLNLPERVENQGGEKETWIYRVEGRKRRTIRFVNGVVVADSTGKGGRRR
jgi:hypothetical protein